MFAQCEAILSQFKNVNEWENSVQSFSIVYNDRNRNHVAKTTITTE